MPSLRGTKKNADPVEQPSVAAMAVGATREAGGTMNSAEQVTPVEIPRAIFTHPFQDCITVMLPYRNIAWQQLVTAHIPRAATDVYTISFRLNSPVDVQTQWSYVADPVPAPDTMSGTQNCPMYWKYYSSFYRYYTVVKSHYRICVRSTNTNGRRWSAWTYHHGMQAPPIYDASFVYPEDRYKSFHPHARCTPCVERASANTLENDDVGMAVIEGDYYPGRHSVQNDVVEDDLAKTWHKVSDVPPLKETCTLILHKSDFQNNFSGDTYFDIKVEVFYTVQFKDLYEAYSYPFLGQGLPAIPGYADQTN